MWVLILFQGEYCTVFDIVHPCQSTLNHSYNVYFSKRKSKFVI